MSRFKENISNDEVAALTKCSFSGVVEVIDTEDKVKEACDYLLSCRAIGFDTETRPSFKPGVCNKTALLQLSGKERCFLFRLSKMKLDKPIIKVLESKEVVKIGAAVRDDIKGLQELRKFKSDNFIDLQNIAGEWGIAEKSVRKLAGIVLGQSVSKAQRLSNWEASNYTPAQINYAATDAWVCLEIYETLMKESK